MYVSKDRWAVSSCLIFCLTYAWLSQSIQLLPFQLNSAFHARTMPEVLAVLGSDCRSWSSWCPAPATG